jgi:DNA-binding CsgD family transcriptional regulator
VTESTQADDADLLSIVGFEIREALDGIELPAYLVDVAGIVSWVNVAANAVLGDRVGQPYLNFIPSDLHARVRTNFARKVYGGTPTVFEIAVLDAAGARRSFRVRSAPLRRDGRIIGIFGLATPMSGSHVVDDEPLALTPRQMEVLRLLADASTTEEIARLLGVSVETARNHIRALLRRLGAHTRLEAVIEARRRGLVGEDGR